MATNDISEILGNTREVLYGDKEDHAGNVTLEYVVQLMTKMDARLSHIEVYVKKIDDLQSSLSSLSTKVCSLEADMKAIRVNSRDLENSVQGLSNLYDSVKEACDKNKTNITQVKTSLKSSNNDTTVVRKELEHLRKEREELKNAITDLQCRSMKNNLIFSGLAENNNENTEEVLRGFICNELGIDFTIEFGNVHRFGKHYDKKPRPIVARFLYYKDLSMVKAKANRLKGKPYGINEQFPADVEQCRKKLYPVAKRLRQAGHRTKMVRDKLFVDGRLYENTSASQTDHRQATPRNSRDTDERDKRPTAKRPRASSTPTSENTRSSGSANTRDSAE